MEEFLKWKRKILQEVDNKINSLKHRIKVHKTSPVLKQGAVIEYWNELHEKYVLVSIDKATNNIAIICKKYYVTVILKEIEILDAGNETYEKINKNQEKISQDNLEYNTRLKLSKERKDKSLPIMYWIHKLHKYPVGSRFIIPKSCSTKSLSKAFFNLSKLIYTQIENFHRKSKFLSNYSKFWVLKTVDPVIENISIMNKKKKAKSIATYDFSALYTTHLLRDCVM